jgi:hypothetical protein
MNLTIRTLLMIVAIIFFVIAIFSDVHWPDFIALGLVLTVGAFVVDELGLGTRVGTRRD